MISLHKEFTVYASLARSIQGNSRNKLRHNNQHSIHTSSNFFSLNSQAFPSFPCISSLFTGFHLKRHFDAKFVTQRNNFNAFLIGSLAVFLFSLYILQQNVNNVSGRFLWMSLFFSVELCFWRSHPFQARGKNYALDIYEMANIKGKPYWINKIKWFHEFVHIEVDKARKVHTCGK